MPRNKCFKKENSCRLIHLKTEEERGGGGKKKEKKIM
jgi:hypothetical protein